MLEKRHAAKSQTPVVVEDAANHTHLHFKSERCFERVLEIKIPRFHWGRTNFGPKHIFMAGFSKPRKVFLMERLTSLSAHHTSKIVAL